jgi:hypothetical protein
MGDMVEAGKYLFLSGQRGPAVDPAISLFLKRHARGQPGDLFAQFPRGVRSTGFSALPDVVRADLERLGMPPSPVRGRHAAAPTSGKSTGVHQSVALIGCAVVVVVVAVATLTGLGVMVQWVAEFVST